MTSINIKVILSVAALTTALTDRSSAATTKYTQKVLIGFGSTRSSNVCLSFAATAESGDFFNGLISHETKHGHEFRKKQKIFVFPETIIIRVLAVSDRCKAADASVKNEGSDIHLDGNFLKSIQFKTFWKQGADIREAKIKRLNAQKTNRIFWETDSADRWEYEIQVVSANIPLIDSFILTLVTPDGREISRLSLRL